MFVINIKNLTHLGCGRKFVVRSTYLETSLWALQSNSCVMLLAVYNVNRWPGNKTGRRAAVWAWHRWIWTVPMSRSACLLGPRVATGRETTTTGQVVPKSRAETRGDGVGIKPSQVVSWTMLSGKKGSRIIWVGARTVSTWKTSKDLAYSWQTGTARTNTFLLAKFEPDFIKLCAIFHRFITGKSWS